MPRAWRHPLTIAAVYLVTWLALDTASQRFDTAPGISVWYPPAALDYVLLLVFGLRFWPLLLLSGGAMLDASRPYWRQRALRRHGQPAHPSELSSHSCAVYLNIAAPNMWRFEGPDGPLAIPALYPSRRNLPSRTRAVIEFLADEFRLDPAISSYLGS